MLSLCETFALRNLRSAELQITQSDFTNIFTYKLLTNDSWLPVFQFSGLAMTFYP